MQRGVNFYKEWSSIYRQENPTVTRAVPTVPATIAIDEDRLIEVGAQLEPHGSILYDHTQRLDALPPTLVTDIDRDVRELYTRSGAVRDEIFSQRYRFNSLKREQKRATVTFEALWRPVLALEAWAGHVDTRLTHMSRAKYDDHILIHDMLRLDALPPTLVTDIDRDVRELYTRSGAVRDEIFSQRYRFNSLKREQKRATVTFEALWRPVLALEAWAGHVDTRLTHMSRAKYDDHILIHDMLVQQAAMQLEL
nr:hypothetical protein [Tanacetum cinerariifolium]